MEFEKVWDKKEIWTMRCDDSFAVEVVHWYRHGVIDKNFNYNSDGVTHKWNVYVIISKTFPVFDELNDDVMESHDCLNDLHWGSTFCEWRYGKDGEIVFKKYGSDYMHLDDDYEDCDGEDHWKAIKIFGDAQRLFNTFLKLKGE